MLPRIPLALLLCSVGCQVAGNHGPMATPQRPTVSSDTQTTAHGTFELEAGGFQVDGGSGSSPLALKYGLTEASELFVQWSPYFRLERNGNHTTGVSDVFVGSRHRLYEDDHGLSLAVQPQLKLPVSDEDRGLSTGEFDFLLAGIATQSLEAWTLVGFAQLDVLGDPSGGALYGTTLAAAVSRALPESFGVFAELAALLLPEIDTEALFTTFGATYTLTPQTVFDLGLVVGLSNDTDDLGMVFGLTQNLARASRR